MQYYRRAGVAWYVIADVTVEKGAERRIDFIVYHLRGRRYHRVAPNEQGRVWLEPVGLWLGQTRDPQGGFMRLACYDPATGEEVGDYTAISRALAESQERLAESQDRLAESQDRLAEESRLRDQAEQRARTEAEARQAEAEARAEAEATIRALQAQLERLRRPES